MVFCPLGPKSSEPLGRILADALDHDHEVAPFHRIALGGRVILRKLEPAELKTLHIHDHATVLGMEQLHQPAAAADEDEHIPIADIAMHLLLDNTYE